MSFKKTAESELWESSRTPTLVGCQIWCWKEEEAESLETTGMDIRFQFPPEATAAFICLLKDLKI
jgi:hypothetical protein